MWNVLKRQAGRGGSGIGRGRRGPPSSARRWLPEGLESLEDRRLPTVVFTAAFPEHITSNDHAQLYDAPVYLIFRGSKWDTPNSSYQTQTYIHAAQALLSSHYLDVIKQYGGNYGSGPIAYYADATINGNAVSDATDDVVEGTIEAATYDGPLPRPSTPAHTPIYVVVTDGAGSSSLPTAAGWNTVFHHGFLGQGDDIAAIWINGSGLDAFTSSLGHEVAEIMTDYGEGGVHVAPDNAAAPTDGDQIGDNGANQINYRMADGVNVQPLWSDADKAWVVTDGSTQRIVDNRQTATLTITGDAPGYSGNDMFAIDHNDSQGTSFALNDQQGTFRDSFFTINVNLGAGSNGVLVRSLSGATTLNIVGATGSNDTVTVGANGSLTNVAGTVNVSNNSGHTALVVDDSGDTSINEFRVTNNAVQHDYSYYNLINYSQGISGYGISSLTVLGGNGGSTTDVLSTSASTPVTIRTGTGTNAVNLHATSGAVTVGGTGGIDSVVVGADGSLASIGGPVQVSNNSPGTTALTIDDALDPVSRDFQVTAGSVRPSGLNGIYFNGSITRLAITDGFAPSSIEVYSVPTYAEVYLDTNWSDPVSIAPSASASVVHYRKPPLYIGLGLFN